MIQKNANLNAKPINININQSSHFRGLITQKLNQDIVFSESLFICSIISFHLWETKSDFYFKIALEFRHPPPIQKQRVLIRDDSISVLKKCTLTTKKKE